MRESRRSGLNDVQRIVVTLAFVIAAFLGAMSLGMLRIELFLLALAMAGAAGALVVRLRRRPGQLRRGGPRPLTSWIASTGVTPPRPPSPPTRPAPSLLPSPPPSPSPATGPRSSPIDGSEDLPVPIFVDYADPQDRQRAWAGPTAAHPVVPGAPAPQADALTTAGQIIPAPRPPDVGQRPPDPQQPAPPLPRRIPGPPHPALAGTDVAGGDLTGTDLTGTDRTSTDLASTGLGRPTLARSPWVTETPDAMEAPGTADAPGTTEAPGTTDAPGTGSPPDDAAGTAGESSPTDPASSPHAPSPGDALSAADTPSPADAASSANAADGATGVDVQTVGIMVVVSDLGRSLRFYAEQLGLSLLDRTPDSATLAFGGGRILLRQVAHTPPDEGRAIQVHIEVSDIDAAYESLRAKKVAFLEPPTMTSQGDRLELWSATFRDPDGHQIALTQWRETPQPTTPTDPDPQTGDTQTGGTQTGAEPSAQDAAPHL